MEKAEAGSGASRGEASNNSQSFLALAPPFGGILCEFNWTRGRVHELNCNDEKSAQGQSFAFSANTVMRNYSALLLLPVRHSCHHVLCLAHGFVQFHFVDWDKLEPLSIRCHRDLHFSSDRQVSWRTEESRTGLSFL